MNERYASISGHKVFEVQKELFKLEQGTSSVETYFQKLKGLWDELATLQPTITCTCGALKEIETRHEKRRLVQFLMGLHDSYTTARGQILMMHPWPTINQAYSLIRTRGKTKANPQCCHI